MPRAVSFGGRILYKTWSRVTWAPSLRRVREVLPVSRKARSRAPTAYLFARRHGRLRRAPAAAAATASCARTKTVQRLLETTEISPMPTPTEAGCPRQGASSEAARADGSSPRCNLLAQEQGAEILARFGRGSRVSAEVGQKSAPEKSPPAGRAHFLWRFGGRATRMKQCPARLTDRRRPFCSAAEMPGGSNKWPPG